MTEPSKEQYFYASPWPWRIWCISVVALVVLPVSFVNRGLLVAGAETGDVLQFLWCVVLAAGIGFFLAFFPGILVIGPFFYGRELKNGGPFMIGDHVRILSGKNKDRIAKIYAEFQGDAVRVDLGKEEKEALDDIYSPVQLMRVAPNEAIRLD